MRYLFILAIILSNLTVLAQDCNIGNETTSADLKSGGFVRNYLLGVKYTLAHEGVLHSINLIGNGTGEGIQMAVYSDSLGTPNTLLVSALGTVGDGATSLAVADTTLPAGDYWIMANYEVGGNPSSAINTIANTVYYQQLPYGSPLPIRATHFDSYEGNDLLYFLEIECL